MLSDIIHHSTFPTQALLAFTCGYFTFDTLSMIQRDARGFLEIIAHHMLCVLGFVLGLASGQVTSVMALLLLTEVNTVFLHIRTLLLLSGEAKDTNNFQIVSFLAISTYIPFRFGVMGYITHVFIRDFNIFPLPHQLLLSVVLGFMVGLYHYKSNSLLLFQNIHNIRLFNNIVAADYLRDTKVKSMH